MKLFLTLFILIITTNAEYNVLFVMIDDLRAEVGPYRNKTVQFTPNIDEFAEEAVTFKHAYANVALCGPSRASLFTGRTPRSLDYFQHNLKDVFDDRIINKSPVQTLPKLFQSLGYSTVGAGKVFHREANLDQFQESLESHSVPCECDEICPKMICYADDDDLTDTPVVDYSLEKLKEFHETGEKFFMSVGIRKPHLPYRVPQRSLDRIKELYGADLEHMTVPDPKNRQDDTSMGNYYCDAMDQYFSAILNAQTGQNLRTSATSRLVYPDYKSENDFNVVSTIDKALKTTITVSTQLGSAPVDDDLLKELKLGYFAAVNWADELFGRIDEQLKLLNFYDNTVVVLFADNGFNLGEQGNFCKNNNFEMGTKVPLFVRHPEGKSGISQKMVTLLDLYPSIVDLALGSSNNHPLITNTKPSLHGHSFENEVIGAESTDDDGLAFSGVFRCWDASSNTILSCESTSDVTVIGFSVRNQLFRYTEWRIFDDYSFDTPLIETEFYDHSQDLDQFPDKIETENLMQYLSTTSKASLPQNVQYSAEYLESVKSHLANHLEAHFSCEDLECVPITETILPTAKPTTAPTNNPVRGPTRSPVEAPTTVSPTTSPTRLLTTSPPRDIEVNAGVNTAVSAAISIVIMLACIAIAAVIIVYTKKKQAEQAQLARKAKQTTFKKKTIK